MTPEADTSHACQFVAPGLENGKIPRFLISFRPFDTDAICFEYTTNLILGLPQAYHRVLGLGPVSRSRPLPKIIQLCG